MKNHTLSLKPPPPIQQSTSKLVRQPKPKIKSTGKDNRLKIDLEVKV